MISRMIKGCTRVCGKSQGYLGLPIRDVEFADGTPAMLTSWEPTPKELAAINAGGSIVIAILGTVPPPMMVMADEKEANI